jgi:hypothetical protein
VFAPEVPLGASCEGPLDTGTSEPQPERANAAKPRAPARMIVRFLFMPSASLRDEG